MLIGILFIIAGLLIAIYPPLLSIIVATLLITIGIILLLIRYHIRKFSRQWENPFIDFFAKF
jgi:uncharacterized membrane protein HdeD (DUF308 family)